MLQLYCIWTLPFRLYVFFLVLFDLLYFCATLWYMSPQQNYNMTKILTLTLFCKIKMKFRIFNTYHIKSKQSRPNQAIPPKYQALTLGLVCRSFEITTAIETHLMMVYSVIFQILTDLTAWSNFANRFLLLFRLRQFYFAFHISKEMDSWFYP